MTPAMSRTDRLAADLERGFTALEEGRIEDASAAAERCLRVDKNHPDVVMLAAATADARGDTEEALGHYRTLAELQPDDPMPRICIARIELRDLESPEAALDTIEAVFDFIDEETDLVEAIYVKTEALLAMHEIKAARETLSELATSAIEDGELALDLAELALAAEDAELAKRWIESARKEPELVGDALHLLGRVHEDAGERDSMLAAWNELLEMDRKAPPGEVTVSEDDVERIATEALQELPDELRAKLANVPILIADLPTPEQVADGLDPRLLGLFQGTPMSEDSAVVPTVTNILLFRRNLERIALDDDHLAEEIRVTVLHETAHYFGLDEEDLERLGLD